MMGGKINNVPQVVNKDGAIGKKEWEAKNGMKVREEKVEKKEKEKVEVEKPKGSLVRWHKGHQIKVSQDGFANMECVQCGITGCTYLTPFEEQCKMPQVYDEYC
jgi:hypothetical protein